MSTLFYRNPRLLLLVVGLILVAGLSSALVLPRMEDPILRERVANINTFFPGADAERVESLVTEKIEDELLEIEEIKELRSVSRVGISTITVELRDDVIDVEPIWSRIRDRLGDVTPFLPDGVQEPEFDQLEMRAFASIIGLKWTRDDQPNYAILRRLTEDLEERVRSVSGTEDVRMFGDPKEEITIRFDPHRLTALGLTAADVARQIKASDAKVSAGQLRGEQFDLVVAIDEELDSIARIGRIPIQLSSGGDFARLSDVSTIEKGISEPPGSLAFIDGTPGIALGLLVRNSYRIDLWDERVKTLLDEYREGLPQGIEVTELFAQNDYVSERLEGLVFNLLVGAGAVIFVILLMMGWRSALVVGSALPLASLIVLTGVRMMGIPIHQMSVTGLIIALGLLIDNAIVIVDEVVENIRHGASPSSAISASVRHLAIPLFGSTLTTALAFAPIALMPGPAGEFVGSIAISVILAIFASFVLAMTITPTLAALVNRIGSPRSEVDGDKRRSIFGELMASGFRSRRLGKLYHATLQTIFAYPLLGVGIGLVLPLLGFLQAAKLPEQFFPPADRDQVQIELELPPHASVASTQALALEIRQELLEHSRVKRVHWFLGESAPTFYYNVVPRRKGTSRYAQALVSLDSAEDVRPLIHSLQAKMDHSFPEARVLVRQLEQGPPFDAPIEVRLFGPDLQVLEEYGRELQGLLVETPRVIHTRSELADRVPKLAFKIDEEEARLAGLDHAAIAKQLNDSLEGAVGGSILEATQELPVRVRVVDERRSGLAPISNLDFLPLGKAAGDGANISYEGIPFSSLASLEVKPEIAAIPRLNGRRMNEIQAFLPAGVLPSEVLAEFKTALEQADVSLPNEYSIEFGGEEAKRDDAVGNLMANVGVLAVLMLATLVLSFGSFRLAGLISAVAFLAVGLGTGALWLFGYPFGFMAIVGTMGLIGVAINDSIVVLAALRANEDARRGDRTAVTKVVERATRHVLSTSLTTMAGFSPLVLAGGGFWPPLAVSIAGGVLGATVLALYFVPSVYLLMHRIPSSDAAPSSEIESTSTTTAMDSPSTSGIATAEREEAPKKNPKTTAPERRPVVAGKRTRYRR